MTILALVLLLGVLIAAGQPIAFALGTIGGVALVWFNLPINLVGQTIYSVLDNTAWAAIPLYLMMGELLVRSGIAKDLYSAIHVWTRHIPGGLGVATILTAAIFAAVSGTSIGTVAALAAVTVPEMIARGYRRSFAYGCLAASGTLGILIPPSITMIIYGMVTEESIPKLFLAGVIPGILLAAVMCAYCVFYSLLYQREVLEPRASWRERLRKSSSAGWGIGLIALVLGGLYAGFFTVTESAAFGALASLMLALIVYRSLNWSSFLSAIRNTVLSSCMILTIIALATLFGSAINVLHIPQDVSAAILDWDISGSAVIIFFNLILFVMGQFLDVPSIMLITLPIFHPAVTGLEFDAIWFAVIMTMNMEVATITPPVGLNIYVLKGAVQDAELKEIVVGCLPFVGLIIAVMIVVGVFPELALWLPRII